MIEKTSSNQPCGRDSEYIIGVFLKSFSIAGMGQAKRIKIRERCRKYYRLKKNLKILSTLSFCSNLFNNEYSC